MLVLFLFYKPVCQVISAWQRGYLRSGWRPGSPCRNEFGNLIAKDEKDEDHVGIITIFLVMVVLQKEHSCSVRTTALSPLIFPRWKGKDFVQIYLFHINILRFKTSQYISGASTSIISEVCRKRISFSARNGKHWTGSWLLNVNSPFVFLLTTHCQKNVEAMAVMLDWAT